MGGIQYYPSPEWSKINPDSGHYSSEVAKTLHGANWKDWFNPEGNPLRPGAFLQDAPRSQLLIEAVERVIEMIPSNKGSRNPELMLEREKRYLRRRFGLDDGKIHSLKEISEEFGVIPERVRQIGAKATRKLRFQAVHSGFLNQFLP